MKKLKQAIMNKLNEAKYFYQDEIVYNEKPLPFWLYFIRYSILGTPIAYIEYKLCGMRGHKFVEYDPCDPEVGPQPYIECEHCGKVMG